MHVTESGKSIIPFGRGERSARRLRGWLVAAAVLGALLLAPAPVRGEQQGVEMKGSNEVEITCGQSRDAWLPILTMGPVNASEEEASLSKDIKVTLKYLFLQGSQRRRLTLLVKWTQNAQVSLEVNPKQLCDSQGATGVRTTVSGQTQTSDGKAVLPEGYIRILPEELD